jgi:hypothetical protein
MTDRAQRAQVLPNDDGQVSETERVDLPNVPDRPCLRHGRARGHDTDHGGEVVGLSDRSCPSSLGTMQPIVLMSPSEALTLLRMAQRCGPIDSGEAVVLAHLVKLASRIVDVVETRSSR